MSDRFEPLLPAVAEFDHDGVAFSRRYGDVYHARAGAIAQARHVFLAGNRLPQRWQGRAQFTVCETGFGAGNNFLALWQAWRQDAQRCGRLHVLSFEAHPFSAASMARLAQRCDPAVRDLAQQLLAAWPVLTPGVHRLDFAGGAVTLTLFFGAIAHTARQAHACVDAFFLDGFAPARNPEMWTPALFGQLRRMAAHGATLATWCSAAAVRKALGDAGFVVTRVPGFAGKREMTLATLRPHMGRLSPPAQTAPVAIVGAGFAGTSIAHALARRNIACTLVDSALAQGPAGVHRNHRAAALSPVLTIDDDHRARLCRAGVLLAGRLWANLNEGRARPLACGALVLGVDTQAQKAMHAAVTRLQFPAEWVQWMDAAQASDTAGLKLAHGGLYFPQGRLIRPAALLPALMQHANKLAAQVTRLRREPCGAWSLLDAAGTVLVQANTVVLANAGGVPALLQASREADMPALARLHRMRHLAGQVSYFRATDALSAPRCIVSGHGYWLPEDEGISTAGSTYVPCPPDCTNPWVNTTRLHHQDDDVGRAAISGQLEVLCGIPRATLEAHAGHAHAWTGWRAAMADHLPVVGTVPGMDGVWAACALGSRGLAYAALAGEFIAAKLAGEPLPLERKFYQRMALR